MIILGIWDGHDAGAALVEEGRLTVAVNEERLSRRKLEIGFPHRAIAECLALRGLSPQSVDAVGLSTSDVAKTLGRLLPWTMEQHYRVRRRLVDPGWGSLLTRRLKYRLTEWPGNGLTRRISRELVARKLADQGLRAPLELVDHHLAHAATAAFIGPAPRGLVLTLDGVGDGLCGLIGSFEAARGLNILSRLPVRHSLGLFFEHVTALLNMRELEDEGKVMALAANALPVPDARNPMLALFRVEGLRLVGRFRGAALHRELARICWRNTAEQFAYMAQRTLEELVVQLARNALAATGESHLALAGGLFANIRLNGRLRLLPEVESCFVFPHMGDGGLAAGAALLVHRRRFPECPFQPLGHPGLGAVYGDAEVGQALREAGDLVWRRCEDPAMEAARHLTRNDVVGWFQGAMEYGPRALGGRSILASAQAPGLARRLNVRLKKRTWYQPFCPAILESDASELLEDLRGPPNRHMTSAYRFREGLRERLADVSGPDGSCRPQIVADDAADPFARLLQETKRLTGLGIVLNTSFNLHGEPLVRTPQEALRAFRDTSLDHLFLAGYRVSR
ncbi:MAG: hypothetical protein HQL56_12580 [Magnetococcales bacterium]|nr:hypothetical protein [Magnetococcales bacterium]